MNPEKMTENIVKKIVKGIVFFIMFVLFMLGVAYVTMLLWNWLVPDLFAGPVLTFYQTLGLLVLMKILFWPISGGKRWSHHRGGPGVAYWAARWKNMSPEQREALKARMQEKWCAPRQPAPTDSETAPQAPQG